MALNNINDHEDIVQEYIYKLDIDSWDQILEDKSKWLNGNILYSIENEVNIIMLLT